MVIAISLVLFDLVWGLFAPTPKPVELLRGLGVETNYKKKYLVEACELASTETKDLSSGLP